MLYFKKTELAETYHISDKTVTNWVKEAKNGKLALELHIEGNRARIANTSRNIVLIERLIEERKKFRNTRGAKVITPKPEFYKLYNQQQIFDITSKLETYREVPFQYGYFDGGAAYWDKYALRLAIEHNPNFLNSTVKLIDMNKGYIDELLTRYKRVNVIDIGAGNALPIKGFLQHLLTKGKLGRYIALDISTSMLKIAEENVHKWFGDKVSFEGHEADINHKGFGELLSNEVIGEHAKETVNIVFVLGGTLVNLRSPDGAFRVIHDSMNRQDFLVYSLKLDSEATRNYFDFGFGGKLPVLDAKAKMIVDLLNIDESFYDVEMGFDAKRYERYMRVRLKVALSIKFDIKGGERTIELNKNDTILLWRYRHQNAPDAVQQLDKNEFDTLQVSRTEDREYLLTISQVKCDR